MINEPYLVTDVWEMPDHNQYSDLEFLTNWEIN